MSRFFCSQGLVTMGNPPYGCGPLAPPPLIPKTTRPSFARWVVLLYRYNCTFSEKVLNAQAAGYAAVIVMNIDSDYISEYC